MISILYAITILEMEISTKKERLQRNTFSPTQELKISEEIMKLENAIDLIKQKLVIF